MHFPNVMLQYTLDYVRMMDNATHLMAQEPVTMRLMHKAPSLWTRAGAPWIFGHDPNKYTTSIPPGVDESFETIWKEQHLRMKLWENLFADRVVLENHVLEAKPLVFVHQMIV